MTAKAVSQQPIMEQNIGSREPVIQPVGSQRFASAISRFLCLTVLFVSSQAFLDTYRPPGVLFEEWEVR